MCVWGGGIKTKSISNWLTQVYLENGHLNREGGGSGHYSLVLSIVLYLLKQ